MRQRKHERTDSAQHAQHGEHHSGDPRPVLQVPQAPADESGNRGADERENRQHHTQPGDNAGASGANVGSACQRRREKAHAQDHQQPRANGEEDSDEMQNCQNGHT